MGFRGLVVCLMIVGTGPFFGTFRPGQRELIMGTCSFLLAEWKAVFEWPIEQCLQEQNQKLLGPMKISLL